MVAKPHRLEEAARAIENCLRELLKAEKDGRIRIQESEWGHLNVVVGSDKFREMNEDERADQVWKHLRENLPAAHFGQLAELTVMDRAQYDGFLAMDEWINRVAGGGEYDFGDRPVSEE